MYQLCVFFNERVLKKVDLVANKSSLEDISRNIIPV